MGGAVDDGGLGESSGSFIGGLGPPEFGEFWVVLAKWGRDLGKGESVLPVVEGDVLILGKGGLVSIHPDLFDRLADNLHQLVFVNEADKGGNKEGQDDPSDHDSQIFEVIEEWLFLFWVGLVPELEHFSEKKHATGS